MVKSKEKNELVAETIMAFEVSTKSDFANIWRTVSMWPTEHKRELAARLMQSLEYENGPMPIAARLHEFRGLKNGWYDGKGQAPSHAELDWLTNAFEQHYSDELPRPYLYPTAESGVQAEWTLGHHDVSLEVNLGNHQAEWQSVNLQTDEQEDRDLSLDDANEWKWIIERIRLLLGVGQ